jgi:hypothetical protein
MRGQRRIVTLFIALVMILSCLPASAAPWMYSWLVAPSASCVPTAQKVLINNGFVGLSTSGSTVSGVSPDGHQFAVISCNVITSSPSPFSRAVGVTYAVVMLTADASTNGSLVLSVSQTLRDGMGGLAPVPTPGPLNPLTSNSISAVPPSKIFPPDSNKWYALNVAGTMPVEANNGVFLARIEIRGWIRAISGTCNAADPDWHLDVEPDPQWLDTLGLSLDTLFRAGSIIASFDTSTGKPATWRNVITQPIIHVELNGWPSSRGASPSSDWVSDPDPVNCPNVFWGFEPMHPFGENPPLHPGDYVRLVGSLVTDEPHDGDGPIGTFSCQTLGICVGDAEERTVELDFAEGLSATDPSNQARWVEMHPPDLLARLPSQQQSNTVRAVELDASNCFVSPCGTQTADFDIPAPSIAPGGGAPSPSAILQVQQLIIGASTNYRTITQGPTMTAFHDHVHILVATQGQGGYGANGKFLAIYRVHY